MDMKMKTLGLKRGNKWKFCKKRFREKMEVARARDM